MTTDRNRIGIQLPRDLPAEQISAFARRSEELGFDELWVVEDLGFRGGIAQAATVLAMTRHIRVGVGILPAGARNAAFTAMEISTLAQLHAGRVIIGIGHGMPAWMRSIGAWPPRPLTFLREYTLALRALLRGEPVQQGRYVVADGVVLTEVPAVVPPILLGVRGPESLTAAGEVADGVVLAEPATPRYISDSLDLVKRRRINAVDPLVVTYDLAAVADDGELARDIVRPSLAVVGEPDWRPHVAHLDFAADLALLRRSCVNGEEFARRLPDSWISVLTLSGTVEQVRLATSGRHKAGASTVVLIPVGGEPLQSLETLARVLPH
jgi:5,10-methylenetetrahydromethanopterin reductase